MKSALDDDRFALPAGLVIGRPKLSPHLPGQFALIIDAHNPIFRAEGTIALGLPGTAALAVDIKNRSIHNISPSCGKSDLIIA